MEKVTSYAAKISFSSEWSVFISAVTYLLVILVVAVLGL